MVQLTLPGTDDQTILRGHITRLRSRWSSRVGDGPHIGEAARVTEQKFAPWRHRALTPSDRRRISAYFGGVVRRRILHMGDAATARARRRLVAASIEADLRSAGWNANAAAEEARRATGLAHGAA